jgi:hypothetical protein
MLLRVVSTTTVFVRLPETVRSCDQMRAWGAV